MIAKPHTIDAAIERTRREIEDPCGVTGINWRALSGGSGYGFMRRLSIEAQRRYDLLSKLRGIQ